MKPTKSNLRTLLCTLLCSIVFSNYANADAPKPVLASVKQALEEELPAGARIVTFSLTDSHVNITGTAEKNAQVSNFLRYIDASGNFVRVELLSIEQVDRQVRFSIIADVKCPGINANLCAAPKRVKSASVYKCTQAGKTVFQDKPCAKAK